LQPIAPNCLDFVEAASELALILIGSALFCRVQPLFEQHLCRIDIMPVRFCPSRYLSRQLCWRYPECRIIAAGQLFNLHLHFGKGYRRFNLFRLATAIQGWEKMGQSIRSGAR